MTNIYERYKAGPRFELATPGWSSDYKSGPQTTALAGLPSWERGLNKVLRGWYKKKEQLENVFVKHYAPNHMIAHEDNKAIIKSLWTVSRS